MNISQKKITPVKLDIRIRRGQKAPSFVANDVFGKTVDLSAYKDEYVLVAFMRYSGCPYCNLAIHRLSVEYPLLKQNGCDVVAFIQSDSGEIIKNIYERHELRPPFPIIADQAKRFYDMYRVESSKKAFYVGQLFGKAASLPYWLNSVGRHGFKQGKIDGDKFLVPATFLIRTKDQKIMSAKYGSSYYDDETFTHVYDTLNFGDPT